MIQQFSGNIPPMPARQAFQAQIEAFGYNQGHCGLFFERYLPIWTMNREGLPQAEAKHAAAFVEHFRDAEKGQRAGLDHHHMRLTQLCQARGGTQFSLLTAAPLAVGLGSDHPSENGFALDTQLGVPYLSGSSLKGLCRAYAKYDYDLGSLYDRSDAMDPTGARAQRYRRWLHLFGRDPDDRHSDDQSGVLIFMAAYPQRWPKLKMDIVNCHMITWQRALMEGQTPKHSDALPIDNPVPVNFMAVDQDIPYRFTVMGRTPDAKSEDIQEGVRLLKAALECLGVGAKTAVGYGVFRPEPIPEHLVCWMNFKDKFRRGKVFRQLEFSAAQVSDFALYEGNKGNTPWQKVAPEDMDWVTIATDIQRLNVHPELDLAQRRDLTIYGDAPALAYFLRSQGLIGASLPTTLLTKDKNGRWMHFKDKGDKGAIPLESEPNAKDRDLSVFALSIGLGAAPEWEDKAIELADTWDLDLEDCERWQLSAPIDEANGPRLLLGLKRYLDRLAERYPTLGDLILNFDDNPILAHYLGLAFQNQSQWRIHLEAPSGIALQL